VTRSAPSAVPPDRGRLAVRRLFLVRHGETEGQSSIRYHGQNDVPLSALGRQQMSALARLLDGVEPVAVIHSPLSRAAESAAILAEHCGWRRELLRIDERLGEISFGFCEGMTAAEIAAAFPDFWAEHQAGRAPGFPGGEPRATFAARVQLAFAEFAGAETAGDLVVVSHRGTVRHGLEALLGPPAGPAGYAVDLGSLSAVAWAGAWRLEQFNVVGGERRC
jgi:broad specificity phosphatase PhoE